MHINWLQFLSERNFICFFASLLRSMVVPLGYYGWHMITVRVAFKSLWPLWVMETVLQHNEHYLRGGYQGTPALRPQFWAQHNEHSAAYIFPCAFEHHKNLVPHSAENRQVRFRFLTGVVAWSCSSPRSCWASQSLLASDSDSGIRLSCSGVNMTTRKRLLKYGTKIWLWKLDSEQESNEKNQCFWTVVLSEDVKNQLERQSIKYRGSEKSWRKRTAILQENCSREIGICWTCVKRKQWKKCIGNTRRKN